MTGSAPKSPPQRRAASDRRLLHYDESRSLQVWDQALRDVSDMSSSALWTRLGNYSRQSEAALATFMEKVSARGAELEAAAAARFDQFRCLPANATPPDVVDGSFLMRGRRPPEGRGRATKRRRGKITAFHPTAYQA